MAKLPMKSSSRLKRVLRQYTHRRTLRAMEAVFRWGWRRGLAIKPRGTTTVRIPQTGRLACGLPMDQDFGLSRMCQGLIGARMTIQVFPPETRVTSIKIGGFECLNPSIQDIARLALQATEPPVGEPSSGEGLA